MSNQTQQQKQNWVKKDPNALSKPKYCTGECGNYMYWDPTAEKASSGKMIPQDVLTGNKHDCPRNSRSPNYDPNLQAVPEPEDVPGFVIDAYNKRKKEHKERLAGQTVIPPPSEEEIDKASELQLTGMMYYISHAANNRTMFEYYKSSNEFKEKTSTFYERCGR